ncbi:MAG TPA: prolyl oligopeptidase family serine peptidase [Ktedonobacterales bacterium]|jgi:predicted peptidase
MQSFSQRLLWCALAVLIIFLGVAAYAANDPGIAAITSPLDGVCQPGLPRTAPTPKKPPAQPSPTSLADDFLTCPFSDVQDAAMPYYLAVPKHLSPFGKYPLVLLLHGGGERGGSTNTPAQNRGVLLNQAYVQIWESAAIQRKWPSFVVVPQLLNGKSWVNVPPAQGTYHLTFLPTDSLRMAKEIVDGLQRVYPEIDPTRLYITGISIGGYGVWDAIERWPEYFAAAAPVSGSGDPTRAQKLIHQPIWAFHGGSDGEPPPSASRAMIDAIRAAGGHPRYTVIPNAGHDIWLQVYSSPDFLSWFFAQRSSLWDNPQP